MDAIFVICRERNNLIESKNAYLKDTDSTMQVLLNFTIQIEWNSYW